MNIAANRLFFVYALRGINRDWKVLLARNSLTMRPQRQLVAAPNRCAAGDDVAPAAIDPVADLPERRKLKAVPLSQMLGLLGSSA